MLEKEMLRFFSLSVLPILVLGVGYIILRIEHKKRIIKEQRDDKNNYQK